MLQPWNTRPLFVCRAAPTLNREKGATAFSRAFVASAMRTLSVDMARYLIRGPRGDAGRTSVSTRVTIPPIAFRTRCALSECDGLPTHDPRLT